MNALEFETGPYYLNQAGSKFRDLTASPSQALRLMVCAMTSGNQYLLVVTEELKNVSMFYLNNINIILCLWAQHQIWLGNRILGSLLFKMLTNWSQEQLYYLYPSNNTGILAVNLPGLKSISESQIIEH